jgi:hypothetical protein
VLVGLLRLLLSSFDKSRLYDTLFAESGDALRACITDVVVIN